MKSRKLTSRGNFYPQYDHDATVLSAPKQYFNLPGPSRFEKRSRLLLQGSWAVFEWRGKQHDCGYNLILETLVILLVTAHEPSALTLNRKGLATSHGMQPCPTTRFTCCTCGLAWGLRDQTRALGSIRRNATGSCLHKPRRPGSCQPTCPALNGLQQPPNRTNVILRAPSAPFLRA